MTREEWLRNAVELLSVSLLEITGNKMPDKWAVSVGFPKTRGKEANGQCWDPKVSAEGVTEMFISPAHTSDVIEGGQCVLSTLLHEMIHASVGLKCGHGGPFLKAIRALDFTGKPTATTVGPALKPILDSVVDALPPYPHAPMRPVEGGAKGNKGGYWPVFISPVDPTYRIQIRGASLAEHGPPICPISGDEMVLSKGRGK